MPVHAIVSAGSRWTQPEHIVTNGPFTLREWRRYDRIILARNPRYYDSALVALNELTFYAVANGATTMSLYRSGATAVTTGIDVPALFPSEPRSQKGLAGETGLRHRRFGHQRPQTAV